MVTEQKRCQAKSKSGQPCRGYAVNGSRFCFTHDPQRASDRKQAHRRGGLARAIQKVSGEAVEVKDVQSVLLLINKVIADTWELDNSPARSRALLAAGDSAIRAMQIGELESRVQKLEQAIGQAKQ